MNTVVWILQFFIALVFIYSGIYKSFLSREKILAAGQTGVAALPMPFVRFVGITELLGVTGIIFPARLNVVPVLTPVSALCFSLVMIPAFFIHYRYKEFKSAIFNLVVFIICLFIAYQYRTLF